MDTNKDKKSRKKLGGPISIKENQDRLDALGQRVKDARIMAGFDTQEKFAIAKNVPRSTYGNVESGGADLDTAELKWLAEALNVSSDYLIGLSSTPSSSLNVQFIARKYGLTEESLKTLLDIVECPLDDYDQIALNTLNLLLSDYSIFVYFFNAIYYNIYLEPDDTKFKFELKVSEKGENIDQDNYIFRRNLDAQMYSELQFATLFRSIEVRWSNFLDSFTSHFKVVPMC